MSHPTNAKRTCVLLVNNPANTQMNAFVVNKSFILLISSNHDNYGHAKTCKYVCDVTYGTHGTEKTAAAQMRACGTDRAITSTPNERLRYCNVMTTMGDASNRQEKCLVQLYAFFIG